MSFNIRQKSGQLPTASTGIAGAAGTVVTGNPITCAAIANGTASALVTLTVSTTSTVLTPSIQVSADGTTWFALQGSAGTARTGTGSPVTTNEVINISGPASCWRYARAVVTVTGTTAIVSAEFYALSYTYLTPAFI